jgi:hypothetical protein
MVPDAEVHDPDGGARVTKGPVAGGDLYIDKATLTRFPADAAVPLEQWRQAPAEFRSTGLRPVCVNWRDSAVYQ